MAAPPRFTEILLLQPLRFLAIFLTVTLIGATALKAADKAAVERQFQTWLQSDIWPKAKKAGVSKKTFSGATKGLTLNWKLPDLRPPGSSAQAPKKQRQAEFRAPSAYFNENNLGALVNRGRGKLATHKKTLAQIEKKYGVPGRIIVAIWGRESGYGAAKIPHDALPILATQAFMGRRKTFFENEFLAALKILQEGHISRNALKSSWAGALGQPQFLPSKFLAFAVDFDGDGRRDIWNSVPDTLASIANYLKQNGWRTGRDWGYEAKIPATVSCTLEGPELGRPIKAWIDLGATRISGRPFPKHEIAHPGFLMMPQGRYGPAFVATENFYVLKTYNESDLYALFIGHLADRYGANKKFLGKWKNVKGINRRDVQNMQVKLENQGHDVGGADGLVGFKTRIAVGLWQLKNGDPPTCFPDAALAKKVR
ncbi:MAG: lytic murein transglycosylase [Stappiaceae bacterium]